jgi:hypothetical protein
LSRVFILSPANCNGTRGQMVQSPRAQFPLAAQLRSAEGAKLGEVFAFVSGLYFRGKLTYARRFAAPPVSGHPAIGDGVQVITPNAGLRGADVAVTLPDMRAFSGSDVHPGNLRYRRPLEASARTFADQIGEDCDVVLLGSVASPKYVDILLEVFGRRLRFPIDFVGRGDMSRGGLLLRRADEGRELEYAPVAGAVVHGPRPPRLPPLKRATGS